MIEASDLVRKMTSISRDGTQALSAGDQPETRSAAGQDPAINPFPPRWRPSSEDRRKIRRALGYSDEFSLRSLRKKDNAELVIPLEYLLIVLFFGLTKFEGSCHFDFSLRIYKETWGFVVDYCNSNYSFFRRLLEDFPPQGISEEVFETALRLISRSRQREAVDRCVSAVADTVCDLILISSRNGGERDKHLEKLEDRLSSASRFPVATYSFAPGGNPAEISVSTLLLDLLDLEGIAIAGSGPETKRAFGQALASEAAIEAQEQSIDFENTLFDFMEYEVQKTKEKKISFPEYFEKKLGFYFLDIGIGETELLDSIKKLFRKELFSRRKILHEETGINRIVLNDASKATGAIRTDLPETFYRVISGNRLGTEILNEWKGLQTGSAVAVYTRRRSSGKAAANSTAAEKPVSPRYRIEYFATSVPKIGDGYCELLETLLKNYLRSRSHFHLVSHLPFTESDKSRLARWKDAEKAVASIRNDRLANLRQNFSAKRRHMQLKATLSALLEPKDTLWLLAYSSGRAS